MTELGWPWNYVGLSDALTDTQAAALTAPTANIRGASLTGSTLSVGGQSVTVHDITTDVRYLTFDDPAAAIQLTSPASRQNVRLPGRVTWDCNGTFRFNYGANRTYDVMLRDRSGTRVLYVERADNRFITAVVTIGVRRLPQVTDEGDATFDVTFWNRSHGAAPDWE